MEVAIEARPLNHLYPSSTALVLGTHRRLRVDNALAEVAYPQFILQGCGLARTYANWGSALYGKHDYDGAIAKYRRAGALDPKSLIFRINLEAAEAEKKIK
jgi:tetratricopeptide (TPR) repeat protein